METSIRKQLAPFCRSSREPLVGRAPSPPEGHAAPVSGTGAKHLKLGGIGQRLDT